MQSAADKASAIAAAVAAATAAADAAFVVLDAPLDAPSLAVGAGPASAGGAQQGSDASGKRATLALLA
jgi:hypothetical protein